MRVLVVSAYPVLPPLHGGRTRTLGIARGLARAGAQVDLLSPWNPGQPLEAELEPGLRCHSHLLAANVLPPLLGRRVASPLALLSLQPAGSPGARHRLRRLEEADVLQLDFCAQADWLERARPGTLRVYSAHNAERDYVAALEAGRPLSSWSLRRVEALERRCVRGSDLVVACGPEDAARLGELYGEPRRLAVVPHGCEAVLGAAERERLRGPARRELGAGEDEQVVVFMAGDAPHNREALGFLTREVMPALGPGHRLLVVGRVARPASGGGVRSLGFVEDARPWLAAADVAVNPVGDSHGATVKVVEYLAAGLPVVATRAGARGLDPLPSGVRLAERSGLAAALAERPSAAPAAPPTWDELGERLLAEYVSALGTSPRSARTPS